MSNDTTKELEAASDAARAKRDAAKLNLDLALHLARQIDHIGDAAVDPDIDPEIRRIAWDMSAARASIDIKKRIAELRADVSRLDDEASAAQREFISSWENDDAA